MIGISQHQQYTSVGKAIMNTAPFDIAAEKYVSLATYRRNGVEVKTPVMDSCGFRALLRFQCGNAGKIKRINVTPQVRLAACDARGKVRGAWIEGQARIVSDPALIVLVLKALRSKYGFVMRLIDVIATLNGRIRRRAYVEIEVGSAASVTSRLAARERWCSS